MDSKKCGHCKETKPFTGFHKDKRTPTGYKNWCKVCVAEQFQTMRKDHPRYVARQEAAKRWRKNMEPKDRWAFTTYHNALARARKKDLEFTITQDWLKQTLPTHCPLLHVEFEFNSNSAVSASLDRIDSDKGYTPDNCWVISAKANRIKSNATLAEIRAVADGLEKLHGD